MEMLRCCLLLRSCCNPGTATTAAATAMGGDGGCCCAGDRMRRRFLCVLRPELEMPWCCCKSCDGGCCWGERLVRWRQDDAVVPAVLHVFFCFGVVQFCFGKGTIQNITTKSNNLFKELGFNSGSRVIV